MLRSFWILFFNFFSITHAGKKITPLYPSLLLPVHLIFFLVSVQVLLTVFCLQGAIQFLVHLFKSSRSPPHFNVGMEAHNKTVPFSLCTTHFIRRMTPLDFSPFPPLCLAVIPLATISVFRFLLPPYFVNFKEKTKPYILSPVILI